jgi:hypothetical protein
MLPLTILALRHLDVKIQDISPLAAQLATIVATAQTILLQAAQNAAMIMTITTMTSVTVAQEKMEGIVRIVAPGDVVNRDRKITTLIIAMIEHTVAIRETHDLEILHEIAIERRTGIATLTVVEPPTTMIDLRVNQASGGTR